ncbi:hypothetical protein [Cohnella rhizosphaerae]|uniref:Uncharacterized protein n=1 Tax=Cohnella rhizosphaerae TaxID=1457232 RepID=A0A9X4QT46_9BACL|nr:hypothetical protein [Cohnella rhizosphaerae]MDG0810250.1 hypothetical protein [Cohnella rhizosphaerae]
MWPDRGALIWKIDSASPLAELAVEYSGRAIVGNPESQSVKWYVSPDGTAWTEVGGIEPGGDEGNYKMARSLQLGAYTSAWTVVYIKCELRETQDDTWASLNDVRIRKKADERELATAELTLTADGGLAGASAPLNLVARYDNGDPVAMNDVRVYYDVGDPALAQATAGGVKLLHAGETTVRAYVYNGGRAVVSNTVTLKILSSVAAGLAATLPKTALGVGDTVSIAASVYNAEGYTIDPSQYSLSFASGDTAVANVSAAGVVTGAAPGRTFVTVRAVQDGLIFERKFDIAVTRVRSIYASDLASRAVCGDESVCNTAAANADYAVATDDVLMTADHAVYARVETGPGVFEPAIRGAYAGSGGPDGTWPVKSQATLLYKLDSLEDVFLGLQAKLRVRAGVFGSKISVYAGASADTANTPVAELTEGGEHRIDLTPWAGQDGTLYVKVVIAETAFDWGGLVSIAFDELTMH